MERFGGNQQPSLCLGCHRHVLGHGPHTGTPCSGHGDHDLMGIVACGHQVAIPCAEPDLGLPADRLDRGGELCQASLEMTTDVPEIGRPRHLDQARRAWACPVLVMLPC